MVEVKATLMSFLSENFDKSNLFEYLKLAASDTESKDNLKEAYWMVVFIYLRKIGLDIADSFTNEKTKQMLANVNVHEFIFK